MTSQISRQEAAKELLTRRSIRRSLTEFARLCGYEPAKHHQLLIDGLEAVERGDIPRLAVFMPPGSAKSTYASVLFVPWLMQRRPKWNVLAASHTTELAEKWGRRVRNLISEHTLPLGIGLAEDSQAAGRWALTTGAEYYAAGVGTGIAGFRANVGLIDDPIRSRQDADSELIRDRIWDWYINDFRTRLVPGSREILIQTRWHEDDLAGRALNHSKWHVISLPAEAEGDDPLGRKPGEWLWSDGDYGYGEQLAELKKNTPARTWSALYQQRPAPEEGDYFRSEWLKPIDVLPDIKTMRVYGGSDYAVTADGGDYTVHAVVGLDPEGRMYLLDLWRRQAASDVWIEAFCELVLCWKPMGWAEEQGQIRAGIGPFLDKRARERQAWVAREQFPTRGDKAVRAQSIRGRMAMGGLYVPAHAPWFAELRSELLSFPAGKHDDQVDALGLVGQLLDKMLVGDPIKTAPPKEDPSGYSERETFDDDTEWMAA
jgi:predicted phage terminase large subunit-like protein